MATHLTEFQRDALKELGNIGAGNAATALSQLLGREVTLSVPNVILVPVEQMVTKVPVQKQIVAAVYLRVYGEIPGRALLILPQDKIFLLLDMIMRKPLGTTREFGETEQSAIKEIGNILVSSYMNAIAKFIGLNSVPSVPALAVDMVEAIFETISAEVAEGGKEALLIETDMIEQVTNLKSTMFLVPDEESMARILKALDSAVHGA